MKIITIKQFANEIKARLYHHKLEEEGIPSMITNAISSSLFPIGAGTISLQIRKEDKKKAKKIIKELDKIYSEDD
ncbi:MAG TPA: hypothetical protein ENK75_01040 [Saprospiraceae bacterium]|jgi:hypothetical protein|nr:hypothetical protein [Saprospiraceae bacterium]HHH53575.1 hypothetical protein [Bacteroidota bacterium]